MIKCHVSLSEKKQQEMHYEDEKQLTLTLQSEHYNNKCILDVKNIINTPKVNKQYAMVIIKSNYYFKQKRF